MRTERPAFEGSQGDALAARLNLPGHRPGAAALFAHCFTCSKDSLAAARISRGLVAAGMAVLRFDFTALGSSGGDFANTTFSSNLDDLLWAAAALRERFAGPPILIRHSLGGTAILAAAARLPEVAAVVTINAPFDPAHVMRLFPSSELSALERNEEVATEIAGRRSGSAGSSSSTPVPMTSTTPSDRSGGHFSSSTPRPTTSWPSTTRGRSSTPHPKSFVALDGADHLLTRAADSTYVASLVAAWASRYVGRQPEV